MDNRKEWKESDLYIGMLFTGNQYCFQGRIEIICIDEKKIKVQLTKDNGTLVSSWIEEWEIVNVLVGFITGEYFVKNTWPENFQIPYTIKGCFNQMKAEINKALQKYIKSTDKIEKNINVCWPINKHIPMFVAQISNDNFYRKEMYVYSSIINSFMVKLCTRYYMYYMLSDYTFIIYPKEDNLLLWE